MSGGMMRVTKRFYTALLALFALVLGQFPLASLPASADPFPLSAPVASTPTTLTVPDELRVGSTVTVNLGTWDANPEPTFETKWYSCTAQVASAGSAVPSGCVVISGATGNDFTIGAAQKNKFLLASITAKNSENTNPGVTSFSASTEVSALPAPLISLSATGTAGSVKFTSATTATLNTKFALDLTGWVTATSFTYQWYRCAQAVTPSANAPTGCAQLAGTSNTYVVTAADVGGYVVPFVTALNGTTISSTARPASTSAVLQAPQLSSASSVTGTPVAVGFELTASNGSWLADPSPSFTYQWYSCTSAVAAATTKNATCAAIAGATSITYAPAADQLNKFIVVQVKASNSANSDVPSSSFSAATTKVLAGPTLTTPPTLGYASVATTGQPIVGSLVTARTGTWAGSPAATKTVQWYVCDAPVNAGSLVIPPGCDALAGATAQSITALLAWQDKYLTFAEIANNSVGSMFAFAGVNLSVQTKPLFSAFPTISGTAKTGQTLTANPRASAVGGDSTATYQWLDCSSAQTAGELPPTGCQAIAGETEPTIVIGSSLEERYLAVRVTLENAAGAVTQYSATSGIVLGDVANLTAPKPLSSNGHTRVGTAINAGVTTWTGFPKPTLTNAWYRCDNPVLAKSPSLPNGCSIISGATSSSYVPVKADSGKYLSAKTVAAQGLALTEIWSATGEQVFEAPNYDSPPALGSQHVLGGSSLATSAGLVRGLPEPSKTYAWYRCTNAVNTDSATVPAGCSVIAGKTASTYEFISADVGKYVLVAISLTNDLGSVKRFTATSAMVNSGPANVSIVAPSTGTAALKVGSTITANDGVWTALPNPTFTYQWYRCQALTAKSATPAPGCTAISGATSRTYLISIADAGMFLSVGVRADNPYASEIVYSPTSTDVGEDIRFEDEPKLLAVRNKGQILTALPLAVRGTPTATQSYRWLRCDNQVLAASAFLPSACMVIPKAVQAAYQLTATDVTKYVVLELTLKNRLGSVTRYTASSQQVLQLPEITGSLTITGDQWLGKTLQAGNYGVSAFPAALPSIQWFRGDLPILGAVTDTYVLTELDVGEVVHYEISARNTVGPIVRSSGTTGIIGSPPRLLLGSIPVVCGVESDSEVGAGAKVWTCPGAWQSTPADIQFSYQWYICTLPHTAAPNVVPPDCALVKKETDFEYLVTTKNETKFVAYKVVASNGTEDRTWMSSTTAKVYVKPQYLTGAKISFPTGQAAKDGSPRVGYTIEAALGNWRGATTNNYRYQWFSCNKAVTQSVLELKANCEEIYRADGSASSRVLTITSDLAGKFLGVHISGLYKYNAQTDDPENSNLDEVFTASTTKFVVEPPINVTPPRIQSRYAYVQATLTATDGTWRGTPTLKQTHNWWVCDAQVVQPTTVKPAGCTVLTGSTGNWKLTLAEKDKYLSQAVTSSNAAGETTMWSASTLEPVSTGPVNTVSPVVSVVGAQNPSTISDLVVTDGTWVGDPTPTLNSYSWFRCENRVTTASEFRDSSCSLIEANASAKTYRPVLEDAGKFIVAAVTFSNGREWVAYSASTTVVNLPPNNLVAPSVEGKPFVGLALTSQVGSWDGSPKPDFARQWFACESSSDLPVISTPSECVAIAKAEAETFKPTVAQLDKYLLLRVTGTNLVGNEVAWSNYTPAVVSGPVKITDPTFTYPAGRLNPVVGSMITTDGGTWQGTPIPTKSYEWLACDVALKTGQDLVPDEAQKCAVIEGANSATLIPSEAVRGKYLMIHVQAVNEHGPADWYSATTSAVWMAPIIDHPVEVFGTMFNELAAKAKFDTWKAFPLVDRKYEWFLCTDLTITAQETLPASCSPISPAAKEAVFKIPASPWNENKRLVVKVVASNEIGTATIYSATSNEIKPGPVNKVPPVVSGATNFSLTGTASIASSTGTWAPSNAILSYQWYRCPKLLSVDDELGEGCEVIAGANTENYQLGAEDPGKSLVVAVRGANEIGASVIYSKSTVLITEKVNNVASPTIVGLPKVESEVTSTDGLWRGFPLPAPSIKRAWLACTTRQVARIAAKAAAGCSVLPRTNKSSFMIPDAAAIIGKYLVFSVTQSNKVGATETKVTAYSASTEPVADFPTILTDAVINPPDGFGVADRPNVGTVWAAAATWKKPFPVQSYRWFTCVSKVSAAPESLAEMPQDCVEISGATSANYTIRLADRGKYLLAVVTGTNAAGAVVSITKSTVDPVDQPPVADPLPTVSGERSGGQTLNASKGTWTPSETVVSYRWYACESPVLTTVSEIPGTCSQRDESSASYIQSEEFDGGKYITAYVSGKFGKATSGYLIASTVGTRLGPNIPVGNSKPILDYDSFLIGNLFTVVTGEWEGIPTPVKTYQWYRCLQPVASSSASLPQNAGCQEISGATEAGYQASRADDGQYLLVSETGTNDSGSSTYFTASSEDPLYAGFEPSSLVFVSADSLEIKPNSPITVSVSPGSWAKPNGGSAVLVHRWVYCTTAVSTVSQRFPTGCSTMFPLKAGRVVADEDKNPLVLDMSTPFAGYYIGSVEYVQKTGSPLFVDNPTNRETFRLSISTAQVKIAPTLWNSSVTTELHATAGGNGYQEPKVGTEAIVGVPVTLTQISAWQADTDPFSERVLKKVTWRGVGTEAGTFAYQWYRCTSAVTAVVTSLPTSCVTIAGATNSSYSPVEADVRSYLSLRVTATNSVGSSTAWTKSTWHVTQKATNVAGAEPTLSEVGQTGVSATVSPGDWIGESSPTLGYNWYLCSTPSFVANSCVVYAGTARSFSVVTLGGRDRERYLVAGVVGTNFPYLSSDTTTNYFKPWETRAYVSSGRIYEAPYWSNGVVDQSAVITPVALIAGNSSSQNNSLAANVGETLRMDAGSEKWNATPSVATNSFTYSWYTCTNIHVGVSRESTAPADCTEISGQTANSLVITESLIGKRVLGRVETQNSYGTGVSYSATTAPVTQKPFNLTAPVVNLNGSEVALKGSMLVGLPGTWGGSPSPTVDPNSYRWYSCTAAVTASATQQAGCVQLTVPVSSTYTPTATDRGKYIVYSLEVKNYINPAPLTASVRHFSASVGPVNMDPEFDATDPQISEKAHVGQTLSLAAPNVTSYPDATTTWIWYSCTTTSSLQNLASVPSTCSQQGVENQTRLTLDETHVGKYIVVFAESFSRTKVTKKNSVFTAAVTREPTNLTPPTISGTPLADGTTALTAVRGTWTALPAVSSGSFAWYLCDEQVLAAGKTKPVGCGALPVQAATLTPGTIRPTRDMGGKFLVLAETATQAANNLGMNTSVIHFSASTAVIKSPPQFNATPSISGIRHVDVALTASFTKLSAFDLDSTSYQWLACTSEVAGGTSVATSGCAEISGANADTFTAGVAQAGKFITVGVTLTNSVKSVTSFAPSTNNRVTMTPVNTSPVTISGASPLVVNSNLTVTEGVWTSAPLAVKSYIWYACNTAQASSADTIPSDCATVQTISNKTFKPTAAERGKYILVVEKASSVVNKSGAGDAFSVSSTLGPILMAPTFTTDPSTAGVQHVGEVIVATMPEVQEYPLFATTYEWLKCDSAVATSATAIPNGCASVGRSAGSSLTLTSAEAGKFIVVIATNSNSQGTAVKTSTATSFVTSTPVSTSSPELSGEPLVANGNLVAVSAGAWNANPAVTIADFSYAWFTCATEKASAPASLPNDCTQVANATASSLSPTNAMAGTYLIARVTATVRTNKQGFGSASAFTSSIGKIRNKPQFGATNPSISGVAHFDELLTATLAPVNGFETPTSTYAWWQCTDAVVAGAADVSSSCTLITGSEGAALRLGAEQVGKRIVLVQTASNLQGSVSKASASTLVVSSTPTITSDPLVSGANTFATGATVTVTRGTWAGSPAPSAGTYSYTWYLCTAAVAAADSLDALCSLASPVSTKADFSTVSLSRDWDGKYLVARETLTTATNKPGTGTARRFSAGFGPINVAATVSLDPTISANTASAGTRLRANLGTWVSNTKPISYSYLWYACGSSIATPQSAVPNPNCSLISGFDTVDLVVPSSAVGKYILLSVTASNAGGKTTKTSKTTNLVTAAAIASARLGWMQ
jgi:hypothetical protein